MLDVRVGERSIRCLRLVYVCFWCSPGHRGSAKAKCYGAWALYLTTLQQIDEAREMYRKGDEVFPGYGTHLRHWALFEKKHGSKEDARDLFEQAAEANPEDYRTWLQVR